MLTPKVLVLTGEGINCERETAMAFDKAGGESTIMTINELIKNPAQLFNYQILALPGGFSYGDEIRSGQVVSLKLKKYLKKELEDFVAKKRPIIGICNGFQVLMKMDIFHINGKREMGLAPNTSGQFINKWAGLSLNKKSPCIWTKGLNPELSLPIRHGEGRVVFNEENRDESYQSLESKDQIVLTYNEDVNGSHKGIAGICDESGVVFGLMPHPEADLFMATNSLANNDPHNKSWGFGIFKNAIEYISNNQGTWS